MKEETKFAGDLYFGTENKKWAADNDDYPEIDNENLKYATFNKNTNKEKIVVMHSTPNPVPEAIDVFNISTDNKDRPAAHESQNVDRRITAYG